MSTDIDTKPLLSKAMLARVTVHFTHLRRIDKKVTREIAIANDVDPEVAGKYTKCLVPHSELKPLQTLASAVRTWHNMNTLPWDDSNNRLLPCANYDRYVEGLRERREKFMTAVNHFVNETYPRLRAQAHLVLHGMYDPADYPSAEQLKYKFGVDRYFAPIPDSNDLRINSIGDETIQEIKATLDQNVNDSFERAMRGAWERLHEVVKNMVDRLRETDSSFHNSLIGNIKEVCELLPALNVTGSMELENMRKKVLELCSYNRETLLASESARLDAAEHADDLLDRMSAYTGAISSIDDETDE